MTGTTGASTTVPRWHVAGDWFDNCKCNVPCSFAQPPAYGDCDGVLAWHIREGGYGDIVLYDLNVLMLASFTGNVWAEHSDAYGAVFVDERADDAQREALQMIFGGQAGSWPAEMVTMFDPEMRGMEFAPSRSRSTRTSPPGAPQSPAASRHGPRPSPARRRRTARASRQPTCRAPRRARASSRPGAGQPPTEPTRSDFQWSREGQLGRT